DWKRRPMSALGQKQTCAVQNCMSALPRKRHQMRHIEHIEMSGEAKSRKALAEQIMSAFPSSADTSGEVSARLLFSKSGRRDPLPQAYLALAADSQAVAQGN